GPIKARVPPQRCKDVSSTPSGVLPSVPVVEWNTGCRWWRTTGWRCATQSDATGRTSAITYMGKCEPLAVASSVFLLAFGHGGTVILTHSTVGRMRALADASKPQKVRHTRAIR